MYIEQAASFFGGHVVIHGSNIARKLQLSSKNMHVLLVNKAKIAYILGSSYVASDDAMTPSV